MPVHHFLSIDWKRCTLTILSALFFDLAASLTAQMNLRDTLIHAAIIIFGTFGAFIQDARKKLEKEEE